jgi:ABC-2 type transport system ATP-binding protein
VCELREVKKQGIRDHVEEILALCGLQEVRKRVLGQLSKGYRQRAGIAQALCGAPEILIFDEPTVGLDPKQTVEIRELIQRLSGEHTVIFSSHILGEVQQICSRVIILDEGRMALDYDARRPESGKMQLRIRIGGKKEEALNRLRHLDGFGDTEVTAEEKGETEFRTSLERGSDSGAALDRAFRTLAASGLPVRMMTEEKEGLEEVFLRVISGQ